MTPVSVNPTDPDVAALLLRHLELMQAGSPAESCHVLDHDELRDANAHMVGVRENGALLGIGAIVLITPDHAEIKSMHTVSAARGRGVGSAIVRCLIDTARARGARRISLETGSDAGFAPARALYEAHGFLECPPFGQYGPDPLSAFMTREV